jgi:hypothetical protein
LAINDERRRESLSNPLVFTGDAIKESRDKLLGWRTLIVLFLESKVSEASSSKWRKLIESS